MQDQFKQDQQKQDQAVYQLARRLEQFMARYGYEKIETPIIQPAELFLTKAGDQIINRLFTFDRLGRQLALRPEFTALAAHTYVTRYPDSAPVVRWQFGGPVFEDEASDDQRFGIGAELIGFGGTHGGAAAEAEIMAMAALGAADQGIEGVTLIIGHEQLMNVLLARFGLDSRTERFLLNHLPTLKQSGKAPILEQLDTLLLGRGASDDFPTDTGSEISTQQMLDVLLDATQRGVTMGGRTRHDIVRRLLEKRHRAAERGQIAAALDFLERWSAICAPPDQAFREIEALVAPDDAEARAILDDWRRVIALLGVYEISMQQIQIQPALARSWDYYTGIVFELWSANGCHFGGGGRYDELTRLIGGDQAVPAVGFAYYVEPLLEALPARPLPTEPAITIKAEPDAYAAAIGWAQALRQRSHAAILLDADAEGGDFTAAPDGSLRRGSTTYQTIDSLITALERAE